MNRGQNPGIAGLTLTRLALCLCICLAILTGTASATSTGAQPPAAQPGRSWENYFGVATLPKGRAVVVGDKGLVMVTDNQGQTWTRQQLKSGLDYFDLFSVAFTADGSSGWAVGDKGIIFHSSDQGATWSEQRGPAGAIGALMKVAVIDAQKACAVGEHGMLVCTADGGANWSKPSTGIGDIGLFDVTFADATNGWAVGEFQTVLHSSDGGASWKVEAGGDRMKASDPYFAVAFSGASNGVVVGLAGIALETADGGKSWKPATLLLDSSSFYAVSPAPAATDAFFLAGENGVVGHLADGRLAQVPSASSYAISGLSFSDSFAMAVGLSGTILLSADAGQHWHSLNNQEQALNQAQ